MLNLSFPLVTATSFLTLHYRLATIEGSDIMSTFNDKPATLQLGQGQLAPSLEACLVGLSEGTTQTFLLNAETAFGPRNPQLIQRVSRTTLTDHSPLGKEYVIGDLVEFNAPGGGTFAGVLREINEEDALFDFNHPLAGRPIEFTAQIIGIL